MRFISSNHLGMHWCCTLECRRTVLCNVYPHAGQLERFFSFDAVSQFHMTWSSFLRSIHSMHNLLKCTKMSLKVGNKICSYILSNHLGMHWCCTYEWQWTVLCTVCPRVVQLERLFLFLSGSQFHMIWSSFPRSTHSTHNSLKCIKTCRWMLIVKYVPHFIYLPGHALVLHLRVSMEGPVQRLPPCSAAW